MAGYAIVGGVMATEAIVGAVAVGVGALAGLAAVKGLSDSKIGSKTKQATKELCDSDEEEEEIHLPWKSLEPYRGQTKRGKTSKGNTYYYEKDHTHKDMEFYKKLGNVGVHVGSVSMLGGPKTKAAVKGRTIEL